MAQPPAPGAQFPSNWATIFSWGLQAELSDGSEGEFGGKSQSFHAVSLPGP